jgi:hypothetical protein
VARLQGQRGGGGVAIGLLVLLILLAVLYVIVLAPLMDWPLAWDVLNLS